MREIEKLQSAYMTMSPVGVELNGLLPNLVQTIILLFISTCRFHQIINKIVQT